MHCIQAFLTSTKKVTAAISLPALPLSPDGPPSSAACCQAPGGLPAGQSNSPPGPPQGTAPPCALVELAMCLPLSRYPFVSLSPGCQDETQKMRFLQSIRTICRATRHKGLSQGLDVFCHGDELAGSITVRGHPAGLAGGQGPWAPARCDDSA